MAGFNNTPPASEFHRHSSWGRTRQPKNIAGAHGVQADISTDAPAGTVGHITENQRFLHLTYKHVDGGNHAADVVVWGFSHSIGVWGKLVDIRGADVKMATISGDVQTQVFEICGIDKVYFQLVERAPNGAPSKGGNDEFYAACSTF